MDRFIRRPVYRCLLLFIIFLFFFNIALISHVVDLQILVQNLIYEAEWSPKSFPIAKQLRFQDTVSECNITDATALDAISRMRTNECQVIVRRILCAKNFENPPALTNTCPSFEISKKGSLIGCFADSKNFRTLSGHHYKFVSENSPQYCVDACIHAGYKYAGVEYQNECHCGDELSNATELTLKACRKYSCPLENNTFCGGYEALAIYSTGIRDKSTLVVDFMKPLALNSTSVRLLFLLQLNGRNVRQIRRLLRAIYSAKHLYLIHVDKRQDYLFHGMLQVEKQLFGLGHRNFHVLKERYATIWGASNLLTMILESVKKAFHDLGWIEWDFLLNLSESDFPILSLSELEFHLARNKKLNFLSSHGRDTGRFIEKQGLDFIFVQCENRMWRLGKRKNFPRNIRLDGGSDWVVLSREFLNYSLSDEELPKSLRETFATVLLPVESFFHTLAANSHFCNRTAKGNLKITNWRRKQGCRCAMLKSVVDWCGCSPLAFTKDDVPKFFDRAAEKRPAFFARKFEGLVSQSAIAIAERRALIDRQHLISPREASLMTTWLNYYSSSIDHSVLLNAWARAIYAMASGKVALTGVCNFSKLKALFVYKANDRTPIKTIAEVQLNCPSYEKEVIQLLIDEKKHLSFFNTGFVEGLLLADVRIGSNSDLKEDILRNYIGPLSEKDEVVAQFWWRTNKNSLGSKMNFTSPRVKIHFRSARGKNISFEIAPYDSVRGVQYGLLPANESMPDEWSLQVDAFGNNTTIPIASTNFVIYPSNAHSVSTLLTGKYYEVLAVCSERKMKGFLLCRETFWSFSSSDPKSRFPLN